MTGEASSKSGLSQAFGVASTYRIIFNHLLGILFALFFGQDQRDSSNLDWVNHVTTLTSG
jgi:hypothetical protein